MKQQESGDTLFGPQQRSTVFPPLNLLPQLLPGLLTLWRQPSPAFLSGARQAQAQEWFPEIEWHPLLQEGLEIRKVNSSSERVSTCPGTPTQHSFLLYRSSSRFCGLTANPLVCCLKGWSPPSLIPSHHRPRYPVHTGKSHLAPQTPVTSLVTCLRSAAEAAPPPHTHQSCPCLRDISFSLP